jgi:hypothetical protein
MSLYSEVLGIEIEEEYLSSSLGLPGELSNADLQLHGLFPVHFVEEFCFDGPPYEFKREGDRFLKKSVNPVSLEEAKEKAKAILENNFDKICERSVRSEEFRNEILLTLVLGEDSPGVRLLRKKQKSLKEGIRAIEESSSISEVRINLEQNVLFDLSPESL